MATDLELVIRGGSVIDGTGARAHRADVGIAGDRIVAIEERLDVAGARVIEADGRLVTPGFVDIHTHLDAQIAWDPAVTPSTWHGVTSVVLGNCGITFAPCRPDDRDRLSELMESVEDIPSAAIRSGMPWDWVTYGDYLGSLDRLAKGPNVGGMVGHTAVRTYVMGERGLEPGRATPQDIEAMVALVDEAMSAGALGFSTSRSLHHRVPDGRPAPVTLAEPAELYAIADALGRHGRGVFGASGPFEEGDLHDLDDVTAELSWMAEVSRRSGRPVSFGLAHRSGDHEAYRRVIELTKAQNSRGAQLRPQTTARGAALLFGIESRTPFDHLPSWRALRAVRNGGKLVAMRDQVRRCQLIAEADEVPSRIPLDEVYVLPPGGPARYDCRPEDRLTAHAERRGVSPAAAYIELLLETDGDLICTWPVLNHDLDAVREMLDDPLVTVGLGDAGAHVGQIMDASQSTFLLSYWVRDRGQWPIEEAVRRLTSDPAGLFGLTDRGVLRPGAYADINVIDLDAMVLDQPEFVFDLPLGAGRYIQTAQGYDATIVNGAVFMEHGQHTGVLPGHLLRG